ncbi:MAG TPA: hypothetical protein VL463_12810 [Kofleriaceae bacterium]|jgi:hypothetical protein|nr:hypothetical protein [Kofleriaceae bacterium]
MAPNDTAADPITIGGKVFAVVDYHVSALDQVTVTLRDDAHVIATGTTAADGSFAITTASGGRALDAYLVVDDGVHRPTYAMSGAPLDGTQDALIIVADDAELARWYTDAGDSWDASKRTLVAAVTDCQPKSTAASITASPAPAHVVYYDPVAQRWDKTLTSSANGFVILTGADASETITAHAGGATFPSHAFATKPGAIVLAVVPPTT